MPACNLFCRRIGPGRCSALRRRMTLRHEPSASSSARASRSRRHASTTWTWPHSSGSWPLRASGGRGRGVIRLVLGGRLAQGAWLRCPSGASTRSATTGRDLDEAVLQALLRALLVPGALGGKAEAEPGVVPRPSNLAGRDGRSMPRSFHSPALRRAKGAHERTGTGRHAWMAGRRAHVCVISRCRSGTPIAARPGDRLEPSSVRRNRCRGTWLTRRACRDRWHALVRSASHLLDRPRDSPYTRG